MPKFRNTSLVASSWAPRSRLSALLFLPSLLVLVLALEEVPDLVDHFGGHHPADDADRESGRTRGDDRAHAGAGTVAVMVVIVMAVVTVAVRVRGTVPVGGGRAVRGPVFSQPADPAVDDRWDE